MRIKRNFFGRLKGFKGRCFWFTVAPSLKPKELKVILFYLCNPSKAK